MTRIPDALVARLYRDAKADRWGLPLPQFREALDASASRTFQQSEPAPRDLEKYLKSLHLEDLALACACAGGDEAAWEHFIREHRPLLYRAADAIDPAGSARELADSLYADLYGTRERDGRRDSLFRYFHGRSSLSTWLRAVLAQRHVDASRARRRLEPLPDDDAALAAASRSTTRPPAQVDPDRMRYLELLQRALTAAIASLDSRDRLRLASYYAQQMTLAQIGRMLGEHEATVSRQLARTRRAIREQVERRLRTDAGLREDQVALCFEYGLEDPGPLDLSDVIRGDFPPGRP